MTWKWTMGVVAVALVAGCSSGSKGLSVSAKAAQGNAAASSSSAALEVGKGLTIERIRMVVRKVEVESETVVASATCPAEDSGDEGGTTAPTTGATTGALTLADQGGGDGGTGGDDGEDCSHELEFGPFLVDLSGADLTNGVHFVFDVPVPAGTYDELAFKVNTISADKAAGAPVEAQRAGLAELAAKQASIVVNGKLDGADYAFATPIEVQQKREGALTVDAAKGAAITLDVDPTGWFKAADGSRLDPTNAANLGAILANIRASIRVTHDEDHDGCDDSLDPTCEAEHHG